VVAKEVGGGQLTALSLSLQELALVDPVLVTFLFWKMTFYSNKQHKK
jgi:hypothetical protein